MWLLSGELRYRERTGALPGLLPRNAAECEKMKSYIYANRTRDPHVFEATTFQEMVELENSDPGGEQWSKDGLYCVSCVKGLYLRRTFEWWKQAKANSELGVKSGLVPY